MSVNSSSADDCSILGFKISVAISVIRAVLTVPLAILVLYLGSQRCRQQHSFKTSSHSDIFTYHMATMNLMWVLASVGYFWGVIAHLEVMALIGFSAICIFFCGEILFHVLTCVDRYLAVVHPITYLGLRKARGVRIRNVSTGCVWLLCFGITAVMFLQFPNYPSIPMLCLLVVALIVVSFCSLSVLYVLTGPGPGEGSRAKERVDQAKHRAFHAIAAITAVLWLWFVGFIIFIALINSPQMSLSVSCVLVVCTGWFQLPSTLVLPLLYLHRAGKLSCCSYSNG